MRENKGYLIVTIRPAQGSSKSPSICTACAICDKLTRSDEQLALMGVPLTCRVSEAEKFPRETWRFQQQAVLYLWLCSAVRHRPCRAQRCLCPQRISVSYQGISSPEKDQKRPLSGLPSSRTFMMPLTLSSTSTYPAPPASSRQIQQWPAQDVASAGFWSSSLH